MQTWCGQTQKMLTHGPWALGEQAGSLVQKWQQRWDLWAVSLLFLLLSSEHAESVFPGGKWFGTAVHNSKGMTSKELFCLRTTERRLQISQSVDIFFFYATESELQYPMQSSTVVLTSENLNAAADIYLNSRILGMGDWAISSLIFTGCSHLSGCILCSFLSMCIFLEIQAFNNRKSTTRHLKQLSMWLFAATCCRDQ